MSENDNTFRIENGTVKFSKASLCTECSRGQVIQGEKEDQYIVRCFAIVENVMVIPFKVTACSSYNARNTFNGFKCYSALKEEAWRLGVLGDRFVAYKRKGAAFLHSYEESSYEQVK